jgi:hypothetical protein
VHGVVLQVGWFAAASDVVDWTLSFAASGKHKHKHTTERTRKVLDAVELEVRSTALTRNTNHESKPTPEIRIDSSARWQI